MWYPGFRATASPTRTIRGCCTWIRLIRMIAATTCARLTPIPWLARWATYRWWVSTAQSHATHAGISLKLKISAVPPNILDIESTPSSVAVRENQNINMTCRADGFPAPKIIWRREDGEEIAVEKKKKGKSERGFIHFMIFKIKQNISVKNGSKFWIFVFHDEYFNVKFSFAISYLIPCPGYPIKTVLVYDGDVLPLTKVSRNEMGAYLCIATNGVPPSVSKRIILDVECKYSMTSLNISRGRN